MSINTIFIHKYSLHLYLTLNRLNPHIKKGEPLLILLLVAGTRLERATSGL